jgi:hypothetical protein
MKSVTAFLGAAIVFAIAGGIGLSVARFQRHMADAQERTATLQYDEAQGSLEAAEGLLAYVSWAPGVGKPALDEIRTREAALRYWQGDYEAVLPAQVEPVAAVDESNPDLQLVVANAAFRAGLARAKERAETLQALNDAVNGYAVVLRNERWNEDAAHNYEFVVRLRDEFAKGRRPPTPQQPQGGDLGEGGAPSPATTTSGFEIYVPLEGNERTPDGGEAGKAEAKQRKG